MKGEEAGAGNFPERVAMTGWQVPWEGVGKGVGEGGAI